MRKTRRALLAWILILACAITGPGVGVAAATVSETGKTTAVCEEPVKAESPEEEEAGIRVCFSCGRENVLYTVTQGEESFLPEEEGYYLLLPGEYLVLAECEGLEPAEMTFTVEEGALEIVLEVTFAEDETAEITSDNPEEETAQEAEEAEEKEELSESPEEETAEVTEEETIGDTEEETAEETTESETEEETAEETDEMETAEETTAEETTEETTAVETEEETGKKNAAETMAEDVLSVKEEKVLSDAGIQGTVPAWSVNFELGQNTIGVGNGQTIYGRFFPEEDGHYVIYSTGDHDTYGYLVDWEGNIIYEDDDNGENENFFLDYDLSMGKPYYIGVRLYSSSASATVDVSVIKTGWVYQDGEWYYYSDSGSPAVGHLMIDDKLYYFQEDGTMRRDGFSVALISGQMQRYYHDTSGVRVTAKGWLATENGYLYFTNQNYPGQFATGWYTVNDKTYYFHPFMVTGAYSVTTGETTERYFFDTSGALREKIGWVKDINGEYYYVKDLHGLIFADTVETIGGKKYLFYEDGRMAHDCVIEYSGVNYFAASSGELTEITQSQGWVKIGGRWYYLKENGALMRGINRIDGVLYGFSDDGVMYDNCQFYFNGWTYRARSGGKLYANAWYQSGERWYYYTENGTPASGLQTVNGSLYYFNSGVMATSGVYTVSGSKYAVASDGKAYELKDGWNKIGTQYYYLKEGRMLQRGVYEINGAFYGFDRDGIMYDNEEFSDMTGALRYYRAKAGGKLYTNTWVQVGSLWYYYGADGASVQGVVTINGKAYIFSWRGCMKTNVFERNESDDALYYADEKGNAKIITSDGLYGTKTGTYYISGGKLLKDVWKKVNGKYYYFKADGTAAEDEILKVGGKNYAFDVTCVMASGGWFTDWDMRTYYAAASGALLEGEQTIDGEKYYFAPEMKTGLVTGSDGKQSLYGRNGVYVGQAEDNAWNKINGSWCYVSDGYLLNDGMYKIGTDWYYFDEAGLMKKDYLDEDDDAIFGSGGKRVKSGWVKLSGTYYYVDPLTMEFVTGERLINGKTYRFADGGRMVTGEFVDENNMLLCIYGSDGALKSKTPIKDGWNLINGRYFYCQGNELPSGWVGEYFVNRAGMLYNTIVDDYVLGADGKRVKSGWFNYSMNGVESNAYVYVKANGKAAKNEWVKINGSWYYFKEDYKALRDCMEIIGGKIYQFDSEGKMTATIADAVKDGWVKAKAGSDYCYVRGMQLCKEVIVTINGSVYGFDETGKMVKNRLLFARDESRELYVTYYFGADGKRSTKTGWLKLDGSWYYIESDYSLASGFRMIGGKTYYFDWDDCRMATGITAVHYYEYSELCEFDSSGAMIGRSSIQNGWVSDGSDWYYMQNGALVCTDDAYGILQINGKEYGFENGKMVKNGAVIIDDSHIYFCGSDGTVVRKTGWVKDAGGQYYYIGAYGECVKGIQKINGKTYLFDSDGRWSS